MSDTFERQWWQARKFQMYLFWVLTSVIGSVVALGQGLPDLVVAGYWVGSGIALRGVFDAHGRSDAAHS